MSKEKKARKHKVLDHPIAALFLLLLWGMTFYQVFGVITQGLLGVNFTGFGAAVGATDASGVVLKMSTYDAATAVIVGVVGLVIGTYLIRKSVRSDIVEVWKERWSRK